MLKVPKDVERGILHVAMFPASSHTRSTTAIYPATPCHGIDDVMHVVQLGFEVVAQLRVQRVERGHAAPKVTVFRCFIRARCEGAEDHVQVGATEDRWRRTARHDVQDDIRE